MIRDGGMIQEELLHQILYRAKGPGYSKSVLQLGGDFQQRPSADRSKSHIDIQQTIEVGVVFDSYQRY